MLLGVRLVRRQSSQEVGFGMLQGCEGVEGIPVLLWTGVVGIECGSVGSE